MTERLAHLPLSWVGVALATIGAGLLLWADRRGEHRLYAFMPLAVVLPLGMIVAWGTAAPAAAGPFGALFSIALLARAREDQLHTELAIKLLWVMGVAFGLSWAGALLLDVAAGTTMPYEQWAVLGLGIDSPLLWSTSLSLALLAGLVLLGGAPFHFWAADVMQGARPWLGPMAVAAMQVSGAAWIERRLAGIESFEPAARVVSVLLAVTAGTAFVVGGFTLGWQRRPERRVGTLASIQGGLALASIMAGHGSPAALPIADLRAWAAHLAIALTGGATVARLLPVAASGPQAPPVLMRRHPWAGMIGLCSIASLAGVPGTPGAAIWLDAARRVTSSGHVWVTCALGFAWLASFACAIGMARDAFGAPSTTPAPERRVPRSIRGALWVSGAGLALMGVMRLLTSR